jgi:type IV fimbrial biogenesis protein FimT
MSRVDQRGISLIEIAIGLAIIGITMAWAVPSYSTWLQNMQIRNMADSIVGGLQQARSEAISRNSAVEFLLTAQNPSAANADLLLPALADDNGRNWMVRANLPPPGPPLYAYITGSIGDEGSRQATVQAGDINIANNLNAVTFDGFGRIRAANADANPPMVKICVGSSVMTPAQGARLLEIDISAGGQIKMCDPTVVVATDPRRCVTAAPRCA